MLLVIINFMLRQNILARVHCDILLYM